MGPENEPAPAPPSPIRVLLVEDLPALVQLLHDALAQYKHPRFEIQSAGTLAECLERLGAAEFDVLVLDLGLPDSRGAATVAAVRARFPSLPIVVLSAASDLESIRAAVQEGAHEYIVKSPVTAQLLPLSIIVVAERKRAEAARQQSEEKYRTLVSEMLTGFAMIEFVYDDAGRAVDYITLEVNRAYEDILNVKREDVIGRRAGEILSPAELAVRLSIFGPVALTGQSARYSAYSPHHGRHFEGTTFALHRGRFAVTFMDVSQRKQAEDELLERRRQIYHMGRVQAMGLLATSLAHEINQPLTGILSNAQTAQRLLLKESPDLAEIREILADIAADGKRAGEVVNRIRAMLRKEPPANAPLDINEAVRAVMALARQELKLHGVSVRADLADKLPPVCGDKTLIDQVIFNLFLNAEQAVEGIDAHRRELVVATVRSEPDQVSVSVRDNGPGIAAELMPRLFDPFVTTKVDGLGMGLAICRSIVTAHGGRIWVENPPDGGARVSFTLPVAEIATGSE